MLPLNTEHDMVCQGWCEHQWDELEGRLLAVPSSTTWVPDLTNAFVDQ